MFFHAPRQGLVSLRLCGQQKWKEEQSDETIGSRGTNTSVGYQVILGMYAARMQAELENFVRKQRLPRVADLCRHHQTMTWLGEIPRRHGRVVLRFGRACEDVSGKVLQIGKQENREILHHLHSLYG